VSAAAAARSPALRVLIVDDSAVVRQLLRDALGAAGMIVHGVADPILALGRMRSWTPDVIVLDLEMPRMDGLTFLRLLRADGSVPVVVCSGVAGERTVLAMRALEEGAVDIVARPRVGGPEVFEESFLLLRDAIHAAAQARPRRAAAAVPVAPVAAAMAATRRRIVAVGASTGGTEALHALVAALPAGAPPVVVVQHMPEGFTAAFAARLGDGARVRVKEAVTGDALEPGTVLVAPGGRHLAVRPGVHGPVAEVFRGPLVARHRPSVDVLFRSVAAIAGRDATGVVLTGMGDDGTDGLRALRAAGARTLAQDEASCVVFGMPKAAIDAGVIDEVVPLERMAAAMLGARGAR
jgi:two-component system, chemotaxis family, protein-glutamate methylesterase/glutaminase